MMAKLAHRYAIMRSVWHGSDTHGVGVHFNLTGLKHTPRSGGTTGTLTACSLPRRRAS